MKKADHSYLLLLRQPGGARWVAGCLDPVVVPWWDDEIDDAITVRAQEATPRKDQRRLQECRSSHARGRWYEF